MNKLSLRLRITIITTLIITFIAILLTIASIGNAKQSYIHLFQGGNTEAKGVSFTLGGISIKDGNGNNVHINQNGISVTGEDGSSANIDKNGIHISSKDAEKQFASNSILYMIIIILVGVIITYFITGYTLKPLTNLNEKVKNINQNNLSERLEDKGGKDEIGSLTNSFNHMLDRLEKSFSNQRRFAANASHELKTPLSIIKTGIQVLKLDSTPSIEDYKENLEITEKSTDRLIKVVDDLLLLSREDGAPFNEQISVLDTFQLIHKEIQPVASYRNITLELNVSNAIVVGNHALFYQALYNIVENAIKYNKDGGYVKIYAKQETSYVLIQITDNGIGIPSDAIPLIFEPFYRVDKSRSREIGGSGLGLSLVKTIIERHHGTIEVSSEVNVGTTFTITFPL